MGEWRNGGTDETKSPFLPFFHSPFPPFLRPTVFPKYYAAIMLCPVLPSKEEEVFFAGRRTCRR